MNEEHVFLAALDLHDASARAAYLDETCGADAGLRRQVEALLASHFRSGEFLDVPVAEQIKAGPIEENTVTMQGGDVSAAIDHKDEPYDLSFLSPATRTDSMGRLGHYEMLQVLGKGGFGIVFRAFDDILQRVVAVKVMAPEIATLSPARKRFLREARSSAAVRHENVVHVYEVGEQPLPYLVMEFVPGETLLQKLNRCGPLDVPEVLRIGRQIAEGLAAAHACDLIHRDIKPSNILLEGGSHKSKITDFGLARAADDASISQSGIVAGTPMFMAPEQALGRALDPRADLFSLGSVLYQMTAGRPPFRANGTLAVLKRVAEDTPRAIREIIPETPQWLCDIISKLHAKNPDDRYQTAREVADVLADCETQLKANSKLKDFSRIPRHKPTAQCSSRWIWAAALVPILASLVVIYLKWPHPQADQSTITIEKQETTKPVTITVIDTAKTLKPETLPPMFRNSIGMEFVIVPKGKSWLGGSKNKLGNEVEVPAEFYMGKYEVTQEEWEKVMEENPSFFSRSGDGRDAVKDIPDADLKRFPVDRVSWDQCQIFVAKLNKLEQETGWVYRLPKEVEWEYACRGGPMSDKLDSTFDFYFSKPTNTLLPEQANFNKGLNGTCKVGSYEPNVLGLYDMHGNVWEWCEDSVKATNGATIRVARGGGWSNLSEFCRAANRSSPPSPRLNSYGFRVARVRSVQVSN